MPTIMEELWFAEGDENPIDDAARESYAARIAEIEGLKPFSGVAQKILDELGDPNFQVHKVRATIEEDLSMAAAVLRLANTAAFMMSTPCDNVAQALIRLGATNVKELVISLVLMGMFKDTDGYGQGVRNHCSATGALARVLDRDLMPDPTPGIYLAGLLHDVGKMLLVQSGEFPPTQLLDEERDKLEAAEGAHGLERHYLGFDHSILGGHALLIWKLPYPIPQVVTRHHQSEDREEFEDEVEQMIALTRVANQLERMVVCDPIEDKKAAKLLCKTPEAKRIGLTVSKLRNMWSELFLARAEAYSLFG